MNARQHSDATASSDADGRSLSEGVVLRIAAAVTQRLVGFVRSMMFCVWLVPQELGRWDMAFSFLMAAPPLIAAGIPGMFGRYAGRFLRRGQLRSFVRRTGAVTAVLATGAVLLIWLQREVIASHLFGSASEAGFVVLLLPAVCVVIGMNFVARLLTGLQRHKVVAAMEFAQSVGFAVLSAVWLLAFQGGDQGLVLAFALATFAPAIVGLRRLAGALPQDVPPTEPSGFWRQLAPFAAWVWLTNLIVNAFHLSDRYMIVNFSGMDGEEALAVLGTYHAVRLVPMLFVALSALVGSVLMPHLAGQWEAGRRDLVSRRVHLTLKLAGLAMTAGAAAVLAAAPFLFEVVLRGKYAGGRSVLPLVLAYCTWFGLVCVLQKYLWCAERARLSTLALAFGLGANVALNLLLLPRFGLAGAVAATLGGVFVSLLLVLSFSRAAGLSSDRGGWWVLVLPAGMLFGVGPLSVALASALGVALRTEWIFSSEEKQLVRETCARFLTKGEAVWRRLRSGAALRRTQVS